MKKERKKRAVKVTLRQKPISGGRLSLYLDYYPPIDKPGSWESEDPGKETQNKEPAKTRREFLNKYIYAPVSFRKKKTTDGTILIPVHPVKYKDYNEQTLKMAEEIRAMRQNELNKPEIYNVIELERLEKFRRGEKSFVDYFKSLADARHGLNRDNWTAALRYLENYTSGALRFSDLTMGFCENFKEYLLTTKSNKSEKAKLSVNSASSYFNKFRAALRQAYSDGMLTTDLFSKVKPIKQAETQKSFLTVEELIRLKETECNNPVLKKAALFSALTGLRFSDIQKLTWKEVIIAGDGPGLRFTQQKTGDQEDLPISKQAFDLLGPMGEPDARVFEGLQYSAFSNKHLYQWIGAAGITKDITFHSFRHTFATIQVNMGTNILVVSKLLGHKSIKSTQVYTHLVDKAKREAADKMPELI